MTRRKDIQILRGIAVALVVLFHLGVPAFSSGFIGVDIFFVISGYLMAKLYDPAQTALFFEKRARRLLPAYFTVVLCVVAAAWFVTVPTDFGQVVDQSRWSVVFGSNVGFWFEESYFDKAAFKPLLHLWSLGVEVQFYLLVPVFYWLLSKHRIAYWMVVCLSLAACVAVLTVSPKTAFFLLPFRLWEFLLGFGAAGRERASSASGALGLLGLAVTLLFPVSGDALSAIIGHPGLVALVATLSTRMILIAGLPRIVERTGVVLEKAGDWSYSIYLAHFPLLVLFMYQPLSGTVLKPAGARNAIAVIVLIAAASFVLYRYVEQRSRQLPARWALPAGIAVLVLGFVGVAAQRSFVPVDELKIYDAWADRDGYRCGKTYRILHPLAASCTITRVAAPTRRIMLVGNSHADAIKSEVAAAAERHNIEVLFLVANTSLMPGGMPARAVVDEARARQVSTIVMHYSPGSAHPRELIALATEAQSSGIRVALVMPVPVWDRHVPKALLTRSLPARTVDDYLLDNATLIDAISTQKFGVYSTVEVFCRPGCVAASPDGRPLYFDAEHLTKTGSRMLAAVLERVMADLSIPG